MKRIVKILSVMFVAGLLVAAAGGAYIYLRLVPELPSIDTLEDTRYQVPLRIYDKNSLLLAEYGEHRRIPVKYDAIPKKLVKAFLAAEDDQFFHHHGVDPLALGAAVYQLVTTGRKTRGGSTITMQVARNFFLSKKKTYTRKLREILLALKIDHEFSKQKILELYLNKIYLGNRAYGIVAAAQVYYGKTLDELSIAQAAMIAGLPKAPSRYNPIINPRRALIRRDHVLRRMAQLGYISEEQYQAALAEPVSAELHGYKISADARYVTEMVRSDVFKQYGKEIYGSGMKVYTTIDDKLQTTANKALRKALLDYDRRHGFRGVNAHIDLSKVKLDPFEDELVKPARVGNLTRGVVKTVEADKVKVILPDYHQVDIPFKKGIDWARKYINENRLGPKISAPSQVLQPGDVIWVEQRGEQWWLAQVPAVEGAIVSLNPANGAILALVGGFDYFRNKFNRVVQARRQPGSNFKPFIYSAALEKGFTASTMINDAPVVFDDDSLEAAWRPENYSGRFFGPTRMREALVKSRNLVSIRILQSIGLRYATEYVQRFGFNKKDMPYDLSLALGSGAFSPLEIVRAYAVFANGGYLIKPYYLDHINSNFDELLQQHQPLIVCNGCDKPIVAKKMAQKPAAETSPGRSTEKSPSTASATATVGAQTEPVQYAPRVITPQNAYIIRSFLREVVRRGTGVRAKALGRTDIAGKTGTTNDQKDAWFSGFNDQVVTTTWVGFDDQKPLGRYETGSHAALPMWVDYMRVALKGVPENVQKQPDGIVTVRIDEDTGKRATAQSRHTRFEIFKAGTEPAPEVVQSDEPGTESGATQNPSPKEEEITEDIF